MKKILLLALTLSIPMVLMVHQVSYAKGANITLGVSFLGNPSGNLCDNMGSMKTGVGGIGIIEVLDVEDRIVTICSISHLTVEGKDSTLRSIPHGPQVGYEWETSFSMSSLNISAGLKLSEFLVPHIGIGFYQGTKSFEKMEAYPYYWEKTTQTKTGFGVNGGVLFFVPIGENYAFSIVGGYHQVFRKVIGGNFWTAGAAIGWSL